MKMNALRIMYAFNLWLSLKSGILADWTPRIFTSTKTWYEARDNCEAIGWRLVVLDTEAKLLSVQQKIDISGMSLWIGFQDEEGDDVFRWMTGDVVGGNNYSNWASTDSADIILGDNNCGFISENWEWHHADCADEKLYICELNDTSITNTWTKYTLYYKYVDWFTANETCNLIGQSLVIIDSQEKAKHLSYQIEFEDQYPWIGFNDKNDNETFFWIDDREIESVGYTNWEEGDPDHGTDDCGLVKDTWRWKDRECDRDRPFICEGNATNVAPRYGEWKFTMYDESVMWTEAKSRCEVEGQRLAVLDHLDKIMDAASQTNHDDVWVGFQRFPGNDTYLWFNGEALQAEKFDNWKPGNPDDGDSLCGYVNDAWLWADSSCTSKKPYICEYLNGCPAGQYKDSFFTCKLSPEKMVESAKDNTTQSNIGYELDEITDIPNNEHSRFGLNPLCYRETKLKHCRHLSQYYRTSLSRPVKLQILNTPQAVTAV